MFKFFQRSLDAAFKRINKPTVYIIFCSPPRLLNMKVLPFLGLVFGAFLKTALNKHTQKTHQHASKQMTASKRCHVSLTQGTVKKATHLLAITDLFVDLSDSVVLKAVLAYSFRVHVTKLRQRNSLFWTFTAEHLTTRSENTKNDYSTRDFIRSKRVHRMKKYGNVW